MAVVFDQVLGVAQAFLRVAAVLHIHVVGVRPFEYLVIDVSLLGLRPLVRVQLVTSPSLLPLMRLICERILAGVPLRSSLLCTRDPALLLLRAQGIRIVLHVHEWLVIANCRSVVTSEAAVSLDQVLPSDVRILWQVCPANKHVLCRRPMHNLPLTLDGDVALLEGVSLPRQLGLGEACPRFVGYSCFSIFCYI